MMSGDSVDHLSNKKELINVAIFKKMCTFALSNDK